VECELDGETEVLGENLLQRNFVYQKSHMTWPGLEPGPPLQEAGDYCLNPTYTGVLIQKVLVAQLVKKYPASYGPESSFTSLKDFRDNLQSSLTNAEIRSISDSRPRPSSFQFIIN
jgi:hypothetical protein